MARLRGAARRPRGLARRGRRRRTVERPRARRRRRRRRRGGRRGRAAVPDPHHPLRTRRRAHRPRPERPPRERTQRAVVAVVPGEGLAALYAAGRARPPSSPAPGSRPRAASWSRPSGGRTPARWCCCPTTPNCVTPRPRRPSRPAPRASASPSSRPAPRSRASPRSPCTSPSGCFDEDVVAMTSAAGATRHAEVAVAERQSWTTAGDLPGR